jgi:hypothetical protein
MALDIKKIFLPSSGIDMVFNINSITPYSKSSIIYDVDYSRATITIAQTANPFSRDTTFKELHLSCIVNEKNRKFRAGVKCTKFKVINDYVLAGKTKVQAVIFKYQLPVEEINIRSAFRLSLGLDYSIKGKIVYKGHELYTGKDFAVKDISMSGIGIVIPRRIKAAHPLAKVRKNEEIAIGVILINNSQEAPVSTFPIKAKAVRIIPDFSEIHSFIGFKIIDLKTDRENILNKYIHAAQIDELKKLSRRDL